MTFSELVIFANFLGKFSQGKNPDFPELIQVPLEKNFWTMMNARTWLDRGIRINCVSPGPIETPLLHASQAVSGERGKQITGKAPRIGEPLEVASVVLFLLTGASGFINGADIGVDGGLAATFNRERFDF